MKRIYTTKSDTSLEPQPRSFRRLLKQMFSGILKRQAGGGQDAFKSEVLQHLKKLESQIEVVTRVMARQEKRKK